MSLTERGPVDAVMALGLVHHLAIGINVPFGMIAEIHRLLKTCEVCQVAKPGGHKPPSSRQCLYAGRPWQKVAIDLVGPMPRTQRENQWILVLTDHFTRWQDAIPLADALLQQ